MRAAVPEVARPELVVRARPPAGLLSREFWRFAGPATLVSVGYIVPLILLTSRADVMGPLRNRPVTRAAAVVVALLLIGLNATMLARTLAG